MNDNFKTISFDEAVVDTKIGLVRNHKEQDPQYPYRYFKMNNIKNNGGISENKFTFVNASNMEVEQYSLKEGDFLFNTRNSYELVGKVCVYYSKYTEPTLFNNNILRARFIKELDPRFIEYAFSDSYVGSQIEKMKSGTTNVVGIYYKSLKSLQLPFPDLHEQKRIVAKLDECFESIDKARANVEKNLQNAKDLFQSQLNQIFSQKGDGWVEKKLSDLSKIMYGFTEKAKSDSGDAKYLRITDIQNKSVLWDEVPYCDINAESLQKYELKYGDIVFARTGATTGKSFLIKDPPTAVFASYLIRVQIIEEVLKPEFLYQYFHTSFYWDKINQGISGSAQGGFNASKLGELSVPYPLNTAEQLKLVGDMVEIEEATILLQANYQQELDALDELKKSILQKAFNGEL